MKTALKFLAHQCYERMFHGSVAIPRVSPGANTGTVHPAGHSHGSEVHSAISLGWELLCSH